MTEIFEVIMLVCFGCSWPMNIIKSLRSKTVKGRSVIFLYLILSGYIAGIISKVVGGNVNYVLAFYAINLAMVFCDTILYYRNRRLDKKRDNVPSSDVASAV